MKILTIDTSSKNSAISIHENKECLGLMNIRQNQSHGETLVPMIKALFDYTGLALDQMDLIAVGEGPGSFTGLRIGMSVAKTLAQVSKTEILQISTLRSLAYAIPSKERILPLLDARGRRVYYGVYQWIEGQLETVQESSLADIDELLENLTFPPVFTGDASLLYEEELQSLGRVAHIPSDLCLADSMAKLALEDFQAGKRQSLFDIKPEYVRPSQAERERKKRC